MSSTILPFKHMAALAICLTALPVSAQDINHQNQDSTAAVIGNDTPQKPLKVGVVLCGGGAKSVAHVGVLKVLERAGIPIDIITGTSMGSIVGGMYAIGYNAEALDSILRSIDWKFMLSDNEDLSLQSVKEREKQYTYLVSRAFSKGKIDVADGGFIKGKNLHELFQKMTAGYSDSIDFNTLPIPFACVATNIIDNSEHDFHSGNLAQAMRASMAIPGAFAPVKLDNKVLVDGGLQNNYPADIARDMGADVLIGVSVQKEDNTIEDLGSTLSVLDQLVSINCKNKYAENLAITDLPIHIDTDEYGVASFTKAAITALIQRGEDTAMEHWDEIMALKRRLGLADDYMPKRPTPLPTTAMHAAVNIDHLKFENMTRRDEAHLRSKFHLSKGDTISPAKAELVTTAMRVELFYKDAYYRFIPEEDGMHVVFTAGQKKASQLSLGVRYDNEEDVSLQMNAEIPLRTIIPTNVDLTLRLGKRIMARADLTLHPGNILRPNLSYTFRHNEMNEYYHGKKNSNITYNQHAVELMPFSMNIRKCFVDLGLRWDYYHFTDLLLNREVEHTQERLENDHYFSYFARLNYISENNWYFPTHGSRLKMEYLYHTDNLAEMDHKAGLSDVSVMWRTSLTMGNRFTLQPMIYGRMLFGSRRPLPFSNALGGEFFGHYIDQQMPFAGITNLQRSKSHVVAAQLQAQQRIGTIHYIILRTAAGQEASDFKELPETKTILGSSASYYCDTLLGPIGGTIGYSNYTKKLGIFVNLGFTF